MVKKKGVKDVKNFKFITNSRTVLWAWIVIIPAPNQSLHKYQMPHMYGMKLLRGNSICSCQSVNSMDVTTQIQRFFCQEFKIYNSEASALHLRWLHSALWALNQPVITKFKHNLPLIQTFKASKAALLKL